MSIIFARLVTLLAAIAVAGTVSAQSAQLPGRQTQADDYTRYELLAPETAQFRIIYEVTATTPGATVFFNVIRKGSEASDEAVYDRMTGERLKFEVVSGTDARAAGLANADKDANYIKIYLARAVPANGGEVRLRIDKTYKDAKSYHREGDAIVFDRPLGIKRNAVVLPAGYELIACNYPSQILSAPDGRISISFINPGTAEVPLVIRARPLAGVPPARANVDGVRPSTPREPQGRPEPGRGATGSERTQDVVRSTGQGRSAAAGAAQSDAAAAPSEAQRLSERARQDREIVYFLQQPESHAFSLYHDYTESRPGVDRYLNVVRQGSTVSNPSARVLDTGETLKVETLKGDAIRRATIDIGEPIRPDSEVVVVRFPAVTGGRSLRLRIEETYTDAARYYVKDSQLVWDRSFGRAYNAVVLPDGWYVTASAMPATVTRLDDGRIRLDYVNPRPDEVNVLLKAGRRK